MRKSRVRRIGGWKVAVVVGRNRDGALGMIGCGCSVEAGIAQGFDIAGVGGMTGFEDIAGAGGMAEVGRRALRIAVGLGLAGRRSLLGVAGP